MMSSFRIERQYVSFVSAEVPCKPEEIEHQSGEAVLQEAETKAAKLVEDAQAQTDEILKTAGVQAKSIVDNATEQAAQIIADAQDRAEAMCEEAHRTGYEQAMMEAAKERAAEQEQNKREFTALLSELRQEYTGKIDSLQGEMIALAIAMARKIIFVKLDEENETFQHFIKEAIVQLKDADMAEVHLSPEDYRRYFGTEQSKKLLTIADTKASVVEEAGLEHGDCIIETEGMVFDYSINKQIATIEEEFLGDRKTGI